MDFMPDIEPCLAVLQQGGIILYPTDTIWGIGCDATNEAAVQRIYSMKQRPEAKSLIVLMADQKDILRYVSNPDPRIEQYLKTVSRPTTVIYDGMINLAANLSDDGSIAIRLTQDPFCRHLIKRFRKPIVSTSANISGSPPPGIFREVSPAIRERVDYVVSYRQDDQTRHLPSSLIQIGRDGQLKILRP